MEPLVVWDIPWVLKQCIRRLEFDLIFENITGMFFIQKTF